MASAADGGTGTGATDADRRARREAISVGSVLGRAFALIGAAPLAVLGLSLMLSALPRVLLDWGIGSLVQRGLGSNGVVLMLAGWSGSSLAGIALTTFVQGAIVGAAIAAAEGRRTPIGATALAALRAFPALLVVAVLASIGIGLGYVLLFVPGMLLATVWAVAAPAVVAERLGPFEGLSRSRWLTRGHRWTVFGLLTLIFVLSWVASGVYTSTVLLAFGLHGANVLTGTSPTIGWGIADCLFKTVTTAVWASARAALYLELRAAREGPGAASLRRIFA